MLKYGMRIRKKRGVVLMKKFAVLYLSSLIAGFSSVYAQTNANPVQNTAQQPTQQQPTQQQASPQQQREIQMAQQGCQKPIGFFPTPSKIMCVLTALGKNQNEVKAKALAIVFTVCQGHVVQAQSNVKLKKYGTLGACLTDPAAVTQINSALTSHGFQEVKVVNPSVLTPVKT
jgi:hypothetical protein